MTTPARRRPGGDEGVSLVLVLIFLLIVGLFAAVALAKSQATLISGGLVRERGQLQYSLDGGVDRGVQQLRSDMALSDPNRCAQPSSPSANGTLSLNNTNVGWDCTLLAGRAKASADATTTDYALVVTSPYDDAFTTQAGASSSLNIGGSIYLNGAVHNSALNKAVVVQNGDLVSPSTRSTCATDLAALTSMTIGSGYLKTCTDQTVDQAQPTVSLGTAPSFIASTDYASGLPVNLSGGRHCQVFFPGRYDTAPVLTNGDNYFVSGPYFFNNVGPWEIKGNALTLTGGARTVSTDSPAVPGDCSSMTDALALTTPGLSPADAATIASFSYSNGVTWVLGGNTTVSAKSGDVSLFSPPAGASSLPMSIVAFPAATNGYSAISSAGGPVDMFTDFSNNTHIFINGKIYAPSAKMTVFSTNNTYAMARGGIVAYQVDLKASASGTGSLAISASGGTSSPPPPFRTVRINATVAGESATNTSVLTISNFPPYRVLIKSWRTT